MLNSLEHYSPSAAQNINPVNQALINFVLQEAHNGKFHQCRALGFTEEIIGRLQSLSPTALNRLINSPFLWIKPHIDQQLLSRIMSKVEHDEQRERLISRVLKLGASSKMMAQFFGIDHSETASRRRALNIATSKGRLPTLKEHQKHAIWERWVDLVKQGEQEHGSQHTAAITNTNSGAELDEMSQLDLMIMIAEEQHVPIALTWQELMLYLNGNTDEADDE